MITSLQQSFFPLTREKPEKKEGGEVKCRKLSRKDVSNDNNQKGRNEEEKKERNRQKKEEGRKRRERGKDANRKKECVVV